MLMLRIFRIFPDSCRLVAAGHYLVDAVRIVGLAAVVGLDQQADTVILGCVGQFCPKADLRTVHKDSHLCGQGNRRLLLRTAGRALPKLNKAPLFLIQQVIRTPRNRQFMCQLQGCIAGIVFQNLNSSQFSIDWLCIFGLEVNVLIADVTAVFKAQKIFIGFVGRLIVNRQALIHADRHKGGVNDAVAVETSMLLSLSFHQLEAFPRKRRQMNRQGHAHLSGNIGMAKGILGQAVLEMGSQIFHLGFNRPSG
ncbi:hypothetical protein STRDD11_01508 [Streptococcus sp. DD11]|nr:hypothetical protein STRDD11_01508 [Streptococcus sp. DD11]